MISFVNDTLYMFKDKDSMMIITKVKKEFDEVILVERPMVLVPQKDGNIGMMPYIYFNDDKEIFIRKSMINIVCSPDKPLLQLYNDTCQKLYSQIDIYNESVDLNKVASNMKQFK